MGKCISDNCLALVKRWEGCDLTAYRDPVGVWTIGYGTTDADRSITGVTIKKGLKISQETAESWLRKSLETKYLPLVLKYDDRYHWNQNQLDALVSFAYNIGSIDQLTADGTRTIKQISAHIPAYNKAGGKVLDGLTRRRREEKALFDRKVSAVSTKKYTVTFQTESKYKTVSYGGNSGVQLRLRSGVAVQRAAGGGHRGRRSADHVQAVRCPAAHGWTAGRTWRRCSRRPPSGTGSPSPVTE